MRVFGIAILAFFFSLGFSQEPELENLQAQSSEPPVAAMDTVPPADAFVLGDEAAYSNNDASVKEAAKDAATSGEASGGLSWQDWTRLAAFTLAIASGIGAAVKHSDAGKYKDDIKTLEDRARASGIYDSEVNNSYKDEWITQYNDQKDGLERSELNRNIFGISAGVFAVAGVVTFFF